MAQEKSFEIKQAAYDLGVVSRNLMQYGETYQINFEDLGRVIAKLARHHPNPRAMEEFFRGLKMTSSGNK